MGVMIPEQVNPENGRADDVDVAALRAELARERALRTQLLSTLQTLGDMVDELRRNKNLLFVAHNGLVAAEPTPLSDK